MTEMITVEKEVYEAVLRNSVRVNDLKEENQQLKELLKECIDDFNNRQYICRDTLAKIDNAIGEKK